MKAIILVGGFGTRLRPLTLSQPKAFLPIFNRPFMAYQIDLLEKAGIRNVIFATGHMAGELRKNLRFIKRPAFRYQIAKEPAPRGTGGAVRFARDLFAAGESESLLVLNGDILCDLDVRRFLSFHKSRNSMCSIALTKVEDARRYGVVDRSSSGQVKKFIEKPAYWNKAAYINAGAYLLAPESIDLIPAGRAVSIEKETFPLLLRKKLPMYGWSIPGYWNDIGTPASYLQVHLDLAARKNRWTENINLRKRGSSSILLAATARVAKNAQTSGVVCIGKGVSVGKGAHLENAVIFQGARIGEEAHVSGAIIGRGAVVEDHAVVSPGAVLGAGTRISKFTRC